MLLSLRAALRRGNPEVLPTFPGWINGMDAHFLKRHQSAKVEAVKQPLK